MKKIYFILPFLMIPFIKVSAQVINHVPSVIQEQTEWCWAGTSDCVLQYFGYPTLQCDIAEYARTQVPSTFGTNNCCLDPTGLCNTPNYIYGYSGSIQDILYHFKKISSTGIYNILDTAGVRAQVKKGTPYFFRWGWTTGGGHFLVGYGLVGSTVYYMNPLYGYEMAEYSWVVNDGTHTWTHTLTLDTTVSTGINTIQEVGNGVRVYPNPSKGEFTIQSSVVSGQLSVGVYNMLGEKVFSEFNIQNPTFNIDLSSRPSGIYLYRITSQDGSLIGQGKLTIQK